MQDDRCLSEAIQSKLIPSTDFLLLRPTLRREGAAPLAAVHQLAVQSLQEPRYFVRKKVLLGKKSPQLRTTTRKMFDNWADGWWRWAMVSRVTHTDHCRAYYSTVDQGYSTTLTTLKSGELSGESIPLYPCSNQRTHSTQPNHSLITYYYIRYFICLLTQHGTRVSCTVYLFVFWLHQNCILRCNKGYFDARIAYRFINGVCRTCEQPHGFQPIEMSGDACWDTRNAQKVYPRQEPRPPGSSFSWGKSAMLMALSLACYSNFSDLELVFDDVSAVKENKDIRPAQPLSNLLWNDFWGTPMSKVRYLQYAMFPGTMWCCFSGAQP